jgi:hypothetical protein
MDSYQLLSFKTAAAALVLYCASLAFYRLYLHPLAKFPGPKLAAVTRWYELYHDVIRNGQYTLEIAELHKVYGRFPSRCFEFECGILTCAFRAYHTHQSS